MGSSVASSALALNWVGTSPLQALRRLQASVASSQGTSPLQALRRLQALEAEASLEASLEARLEATLEAAVADTR